MKEYDDQSEVYTNLGKGEVTPGIIDYLVQKYNSATTIDKKLKAYLEYRDYKAIRKKIRL